ncbi:MAG: glycosyltransferase [Proteobacteria bacterium]|nr:glycosyltransferase [Pseudomonadota bacterium]
MNKMPYDTGETLISRKKVSAFVLTYNAGDAIVACLKSLLWADEVFIVDSGSRDNTLDRLDCLALRY